MGADLSILIPTYNRAEYLKEALESIRAAGSGVLGRCEVLVSDNASSDRTSNVVDSFCDINLIYHRNAWNIGPVENILQLCARSTGRYVLFLSDDDLLCPGALSSLLGHISSQPELGVIASPLDLFEDGFPENIVGRRRFPVGGRDIILTKGPEAVAGLFLRTSCFSGLVIRRDLLDVDGTRRHGQSLYPQMYLVGYAAKQADALYLAEPLVKLRINPVRYWTYSRDYMAGAVLDILKDITRDEPWGLRVRHNLVKKRVLAVYGPLLTARERSWRDFIRAALGLGSVPEYRASSTFWVMVMGVGVLGCKGIHFVRRLIPTPPLDVVK